MSASLSHATRSVLAHEIRLALRGVADMAGPKTALRPWRIAGVLAVVCTIIFGVSHLLLKSAGDLDPTDPRVQITLTINLAFLFVLMISAALDSAAYALYARGDYDLMFSAPLPPQSVLLIRALNVFGFTLAKAGLYGAPALILLSLQRGPHWLAGLPLIMALALGATAIAIALTMGMVRLIGIRSTRVAAQIAAALAGLLVIVMVQWEAIFGPGPKDALVASYGANPQSIFWQWATLPARAVTGDVMALSAVMVGSAVVAVLIFAGLAESFVRNAVLAAGSAAPVPARPRRSRASFGSSPMAALMLKERRLILRDPWLLSQILMQCIFLMPFAVVTVYRVANRADDAAALVPVLIVLSGQIAGGLTWIAMSADDAAELALNATLETRLRARARFGAIGWLAVTVDAAANRRFLGGAGQSARGRLRHCLRHSRQCVASTQIGEDRPDQAAHEESHFGYADRTSRLDDGGGSRLAPAVGKLRGHDAGCGPCGGNDGCAVRSPPAQSSLSQRAHPTDADRARFSARQPTPAAAWPTRKRADRQPQNLRSTEAAPLAAALRSQMGSRVVPVDLGPSPPW